MLRVLLNDPAILLAFLSEVVAIVFFIFEKEDPRKRKIIGFIALILFILLVFVWRRGPYRGWVICWHGTSIDQNTGYEFLAAYPEAAVKEGMDLNTPRIVPWEGKLGYYTNDSSNSKSETGLGRLGSNFETFFHEKE